MFARGICACALAVALRVPVQTAGNTGELQALPAEMQVTRPDPQELSQRRVREKPKPASKAPPGNTKRGFSELLKGFPPKGALLARIHRS